MFRKFILPLLAVAGVLFAVYSVVSSTRQTPAAAPVAQAVANHAVAKAMLAQLKAGTWGPDLDIARADVESAKATVAGTETALDRLVVRSPIDGRVMQVNVRVGEYAQAGNQGGPATA